MTNPEAVEKAPQVGLPAPVDFSDEIRRGLRSHPVELSHRLGLKLVEIRVVAHEARGHQLVDDGLPEAFDVHRASRRKVLETTPEPGGARDVLATPDDLMLRPDEQAAAGRARAGHLPWRLARRSLFEDRADHFRDDLAPLFDNDDVALANVAARDLLVVVERGFLHGGAGHEHRLEHGERRHGPRAPDVDVNPQEPAARLLRGKLERDCPSWELRRRARPRPERQIVELDDDAV